MCGKAEPNQRLIQSKAANAKWLVSLIEDYVGVSVVGGSLCWCCEGKLVTIDKKVVNIQGEYIPHDIALSYNVRVTRWLISGDSPTLGAHVNICVGL